MRRELPLEVASPEASVFFVESFMRRMRPPSQAMYESRTLYTSFVLVFEFHVKKLIAC
jgi:hypothetical protein